MLLVESSGMWKKFGKTLKLKTGDYGNEYGKKKFLLVDVFLNFQDM